MTATTRQAIATICAIPFVIGLAEWLLSAAQVGVA